MTSLAHMYAYGNGKSKDSSQASIILNESLKYDKDYIDTYYVLAAVYYELERYDESINSANTFLEKEKDKNKKFDGYNVLENSYLGKNDLEKAKESFNKALGLNPNDEYAKTNLGYTK